MNSSRVQVVVRNEKVTVVHATAGPQGNQGVPGPQGLPGETNSLRRDTAANFRAVNPTLLEDEWALETDTNEVKIGDGVTAWNGLSYLLEGKPNMFVQNNVPVMVSGDLWLDTTTL